MALGAEDVCAISNLKLSAAACNADLLYQQWVPLRFDGERKNTVATLLLQKTNAFQVD